MSARIPAFEEHGEVLACWQRLGFREETLVLLDRHLDFKRIGAGPLERLRASSECGPLNRETPFRDEEGACYGLDDFLYAAAALQLIRRVVWVVPEVRPIGLGVLADALFEQLSLVPGHGPEIERSIAVGSHAVSTEVAGLRIDVTTLRRLPHLGLPSLARLDFDLDFFYADQPRPTHDPAEVAALLRTEWPDAPPPTMTYSISSGFMPESFRWIGQELGAGLGFSVDKPPPRRRFAPVSLARLARKERLGRKEFDHLRTEELAALGGKGHALAALLALRIPDLREAERCWEQARASGSGAHWAAYNIGLAFIERKDYGAAAGWLECAVGDGSDTIAVHAMCVRSMALCRLERWEEALAAADAAADMVPLRVEPHRLAGIAAARLGREARAVQARACLAALGALRERLAR